MNKKKLIKQYIKHVLLESSNYKSTYAFSATEEIEFRHLYNFLRQNVDDKYKEVRKRFNPFDDDKLIDKHGKKFVEERLVFNLDKMLNYDESRKYIRKLSPVHGSAKRKLVYLYHDINGRDIVMIDDGNLIKLPKRNIIGTYEKILKSLIPNTDSFNKDLLEELLKNAKTSFDPMR